MTLSGKQGSSPALAAFRAIDGAIGGLLQTVLAAPGNLISEIDRFRLVREKTLRVLGVSEEQASWTPRRDVWSIAQIADHLLRSEELYRKQFHRLIEMARQGRNSPILIDLIEIDTSLAGIPRDVMRFFETPVRMISRFVPNPVREALIRHPVVPSLNPNVTEPRPGMTIEQLRGDLATSLAETESLLRAPLPSNIDGPTIDHPLMGSNNLQELVRIMIAHEERHQGQIEALWSAAGFPKMAGGTACPTKTD